MKLAILGTGMIGKVVAREITDVSTDIGLLLADVNAGSAAALATSLAGQITAVGCDAHSRCFKNS